MWTNQRNVSCSLCVRGTTIDITTSVVTVAGICNSVGGGVLFDIPPRWRWPVQYALCIACQSSVPFPSPHVSSQRTRQPPPPLLIIRCSTTRHSHRGGRSCDRSRRRLPRSTAHDGTPWRWPMPSSQACCLLISSAQRRSSLIADVTGAQYKN